MAAAKHEDLDCWSLTVRLPSAQLIRNEHGHSLPHSLRVQHEPAPPSPISPDAATAAAAGAGASRLQPQASPPATGGGAGTRRGPGVRAVGLFWNYVSVGLDARAAYYFHDLRERKPHLASNRMANQFWYSFFGCTSGAIHPPFPRPARLCHPLFRIARAPAACTAFPPVPSSLRAVCNLCANGTTHALFARRAHQCPQVGSAAPRT